MNTARFRDICWAVNWLLKAIAIVCGLFFLIGVGKFLFSPNATVFSSAGQTWYVAISLITEKMTKTQESLADSYAKLLALPFFSYLFWYASRICSDISAGQTPFSKLQLTRFKRIAYLVLLLALIQPFAYTLILSLISGTFALTLSLGPLFLCGILLYCFSGIINYGVALQTFSDDAV